MTERDTGQVSAEAAWIYEDFFVPALFARWPHHLLAAAGVAAGERVLDVACGTGVVARAALEVVGERGAVTAIDANAGMLAVARTKSARIDWRSGVAENLPFASASFDRVLCQFALMFFTDRARALREMARVTGAGGTCTLAVWASLADTPGYAAITELLRELCGAEVASLMEAPYCLGERAEFARLLDSAGIGEARIETVIDKARFPSLDAWLFTDIKGWTLANVIDDAGYAELQRAAPARLARFVKADGSVEFDAPAHLATLACADLDR